MTGDWAAGRPKAGEKRPRPTGVPEKDPDVDNINMEEVPADEVLFQKVEQKKDPIANATMDDVEFTTELDGNELSFSPS